MDFQLMQNDSIIHTRSQSQNKLRWKAAQMTKVEYNKNIIGSIKYSEPYATNKKVLSNKIPTVIGRQNQLSKLEHAIDESQKVEI